MRHLQTPALLCLGIFLVSYMLFAIRALIAPLVRDLDGTVATIQTALVMFSLVAAFTVPSFGAVTASYGVRWAFRAGLLLMAASGLVTAMAPTILGLFIGFSFLGGLAVAPLISLSWTLMQRLYEGKQRDLGLAALGAATGLGGAIAPAAAGLLADNASWRWALVIPVVQAIVCLPLTASLSDRRAGLPQPVHWAAVVLALLAFGMILSGVSVAAEYGWWEVRKTFLILGIWPQPFPISVAPVLICSGILLLGLWMLERRSRRAQQREQAFRLGLLGSRTFIAGTVTAALTGSAIAGLFFALFVYVPYSYELGGFAVSLAILPLNIGLMLMGATGGLVARWLPPRRAVQLGLVVALAGVGLLFFQLSQHSLVSQLMPGMLVIGLGAGLVYALAPGLTLAIPDPDDALEANGVFNAFQDLGGSIGTAMLGGLLMVAASALLVHSLNDVSEAQLPGSAQRELTFQVSQALQTMKPEQRKQAAASLPSDVRDTVEGLARDSIVDAMRLTVVGVGLALLLALMASTGLPTGESSPRPPSS